MAGVALPGGRTLTGSHVDPPEPPVRTFCGDPPTVGQTLPGGRTLVGRSVCEGDPLLDEAVLYIDAAHGTGANEGTAGAALDISGQAAVVPADGWEGDALVGQATLDGDYDDSVDWPTDQLHVRFTTSLFANLSLEDFGQQVVVIPYTPNEGEDSWIEVNVHVPPVSGLHPLGSVAISLETGANDPDSDTRYWSSGPIPGWDWREGVGTFDGEVIVEADGTFIVKVDGQTVHTEEMGSVTFGEPDDAPEVRVGSGALGALQLVEVLDGVDGDPIISFDASDPTGWTVGTVGSRIGEAPSESAFFAGDGTSVTVTDDDALDIGASADATWALWFDTAALADANGEVFEYLRRRTGTLGASGNGLVFRDLKVDAQMIDGFGSTLGDGSAGATHQRSAYVDTAYTAGRHLAVLVVDRTAGSWTMYVDGTARATQTLSALGAVDPAAGLELRTAWHHAVAKWDEVIDPADIAAARP